MSQIRFDVTPEQRELIRKIADRADAELFKPQAVPQTKLDTIMDLSATIAQGCPLRLDELLAADKFNFSHDIAGIYRHLNRKTGKLENCFVPRFAAR